MCGSARHLESRLSVGDAGFIRVQGFRVRVWGLGFRVWGLGFRVWGLGFIPRGSIYTTIMELAPERPSPLWFWGPNSRIVEYMDPLG